MADSSAMLFFGGLLSISLAWMARRFFEGNARNFMGLLAIELAGAAFAGVLVVRAHLIGSPVVFSTSEAWPTFLFSAGNLEAVLFLALLRLLITILGSAIKPLESGIYVCALFASCASGTATVAAVMSIASALMILQNAWAPRAELFIGTMLPLVGMVLFILLGVPAWTSVGPALLTQVLLLAILFSKHEEAHGSLVPLVATALIIVFNIKDSAADSMPHLVVTLAGFFSVLMGFIFLSRNQKEKTALLFFLISLAFIGLKLTVLENIAPSRIAAAGSAAALLTVFALMKNARTQKWFLSQQSRTTRPWLRNAEPWFQWRPELFSAELYDKAVAPAITGTLSGFGKLSSFVENGNEVWYFLVAWIGALILWTIL